jgi:hypothetical protein
MKSFFTAALLALTLGLGSLGALNPAVAATPTAFTPKITYRGDSYTYINANGIRIIHFSGYDWQVRTAGDGGPGPNHWSPDNVWLDSQGNVHLAIIKQPNGQWTNGELSTLDSLGFGKYEFVVDSHVNPLDQMDLNTVLGLFPYPEKTLGPDGTNEIDIELSHWGNPKNMFINYSTWPVSNLALGQQWHGCNMKVRNMLSTHQFTWGPTNVLFQSFEGSSTTPFAQYNYQPPDYLDRVAQQPMPLHINIWSFKGQPPVTGHQQEIVIRSFKFTSLDQVAPSSAPITNTP